MRKLSIIALLTIISITTKGQNLYFNIKNLDNQNVSFADVKGSKLTVFDFWATWCKPCVQLMPKLNDIALAYNGNEAINIVGVNIDDPRSMNKVKPFVNSMGIKYNVLLDTDQDLAASLNVNAIPALVIVDGQGNILWWHEGYSYGDETILKEKIESLLEK